jgi:glycosyltransferase involved in cell wall biosynthesis
MKLAYITAGAAGMFCGSCMHDNTLARAMIAQGHDVALVPLYTPIRTDEQSVTVDKVFFGGINVYLQQRSALFRWLPRWMDRWLDSPAIIRLATSFGISTEAKMLGALAVSVLQGSEGRQQKEVERLVDWLESDLKPELVLFTNMLVAGSATEIKRRLKVPVVVTLQGDDIFLGDLIEPYKTQALEAVRKLDSVVDAYLVNSRYYADAMAEFMGLSRDKFRILPLGIDTRDFVAFEREEQERPATLGYLARLAPEKGLHNLVEAFIRLKQMPDMQKVLLEIAGWLGPQHQQYAEEQFDKLRAAGLQDSFRYWGEVDRQQKLDFLRQIDVLSVPTPYREPKGLFVLEALSAGVPVVQPAHGAFPELLEATGGGVLVPPEDPAALAEALHVLLRDSALRRELGTQGRTTVLENFHAAAIAQRTVNVLEVVLLSKSEA